MKSGLKITIFLLGLLNTSLTMGQERSVQVAIKIDENFREPSITNNSRYATETFKFRDFDEIRNVEKLNYGKQSNSSRIRKTSKYLEGIYFMEVETSVLSSFIEELESYPNVIYVEPIYQEHLLLVPNDPLRNSQDYLSVIKAYEAWDVTTGNPDIVIAVSDNGFETTHEDYEGKIFENLSDPENGVDDDGNGFVDDTFGYDLADGDNVPSADLSDHGSRVAGIAAAATNNNKGIAGVGYNTSFFPLKVFKSTDGFSSGTYMSVIYAADMGFDVINLSWGSTGSYSQLNQDIINYATLEHDVVVVAAAGNTNAELEFYPASYDNVLSVGASNVDDTKAGFATYSYKIDLIAPGGSILGTARGNNYSAGLGSSFSTPQVAGAAALVRDVFPDLDAIQIMEQLRVTSDDVYEIGTNNDYLGQLGKGRLNVERAVRDDTIPSIRAVNFSYSGPYGQEVFFRDTVVIEMDLVNYLRTFSNGNIQISTTSSYASLLHNSFEIGTLSEYDSIKSVQFKVLLSEATPPDERIILRLDFADEKGYSDFQYVEFSTGTTKLLASNSNIEMTIASNGRLGYEIDTLANGVGLKYQGTSVAKVMGIMVGNHADSISDNVINNYEHFSFNSDFKSNKTIRYFEHELADQYIRNSFSDSLATNVQGIMIEQEFLNWSDPDNDDFLVTEYYVSNISDKERTVMRFGLFTDFNVGDSLTNFVAWDAANSLAYTYNQNVEDPYIGLALLTDQSVFVNAIDLFDQNGDPLDMALDFTDQLKYDYLNAEKVSAGGVDGNDVAQLLSVDLAQFTSGSSHKLAFAWVFGTSLEELQQNVAKAKTKYEEFLNKPSLERTVFECKSVDVEISSEKTIFVYSDIQASNQIASGMNFNLGSFENDTSFYFQIQSAALSDVYKMDLVIYDPKAAFNADQDTLYLGDTQTDAVQFTDASFDAVSWNWDLGNGSQTIVQNPKGIYKSEGLYTVSLDIVASNGCTDRIEKDILVAERSEDPVIDNQTICKGTAVSISASNSSELKFYVSNTDHQPLFEGAELVTGEISRDTVFYVSSVANVFESHRVPVVIDVDDITARFDYQPDTTNFSSSQLLRLSDQSLNKQSLEWVINGNSIGTEDNTIFDYSELITLSIKQRVYSPLGCKDSVIVNIDISQSQTPSGDNQNICRWDSVQLDLSDGEFFIYYSNPDKTQIIQKGKNPFFGPIDRDSTFYVTNVSDLGESDMIQIEIIVDPFDPQISADPDSLHIATARNVTFSTDDATIISYQWFIDNVFKEIAGSPTLFFDELGSYNVMLISESNKHCVDTSYLEYLVYEITDVSPQILEMIQIFPNPVEDMLILKMNSGIRPKNVKLFNTTGQEVEIEYAFDGSRLIYSTSHLTSGMYFLNGEISGLPFQFKLVKN